VGEAFECRGDGDQRRAGSVSEELSARATEFAGETAVDWRDAGRGT
jgi:hypothetical protein